MPHPSIAGQPRGQAIRQDRHGRFAPQRLISLCFVVAVNEGIARHAIPHIVEPIAHCPKRASKLLRCYAERKHPIETAKATGLSRNTVYRHYRLIRERLIAVRYYDNGAHSFDEAGLGPELKSQLTGRKRIRSGNVYAHAAQLIDWLAEWPPRLVVKHLRKVVWLTGPLDEPKTQSEPEAARLQAYICYARAELIHDRARASEDEGEYQKDYTTRARVAVASAWRAYRAACKRVERDRG